MTEPTHVIVGLGNPGPEYRGHRHNVGFRTVEALADAWGWTWNLKKDHAWCEGTRDGRAVVLVKPLGYMNRSGQGLQGWADGAGVGLTGASARDEEEPESGAAEIQPLVVCDDLNLPLGSVRLRARGRSGGQNGLASVIEQLGGEFPRLRLGIAPVGEEVDPADWAAFVLEDFEPGETEDVAAMITHGAKALECWLKEGLEAAISRFNRRIRPEPDPEA